MHPLLNIEHLQVDFVSEQEHVSAVRDISLQVNRGEILAIVGESGSGKSVTALSILQLLSQPPARYVQGRIFFSPDGNEPADLLTLSQQQLRHIRGNRISMIFQEPMTSLNPVFSCGNQVMEAIMLHRQISRDEARRQTIALFEKVKLPSPGQLFHRYPHQLSGGQKQRVMIAMAMSCQPALLICDEPTTALDVTVQKTILHLISELQQAGGMGVIFITHDLGVVAEIAHRVVVMYKGRIAEEGSIDQIFDRPQHPYTKALLACRPALHARGRRLPVVSDFMKVDEKGNIREPVEPGPGAMRPIGESPSNYEEASAAITTEQVTPVGESHSGHEQASGGTETEKPAVPQHSHLANNILLKVEHLNVWFPSRKSWLGRPLAFTKAVDDVSFEVYEGETLGLVGESGCGKTTLGRTLLRLIDPLSGHIHYKGIDMAAQKANYLRELRKEMQIVFQDPYSSLNPRLTIGEAIAEPLKVHGMVNSRRALHGQVVSLLEKVQLQAHHYDRYPHEFSGGQRQRIVIARALALHPSFLVCDESVSALDVSVQAQVLNLLNDLKKEYGFTVIFISHDLAVVRYISDRIMVMSRGRIIETGPAEQVYLNPQTEYTKQLINSQPKMKR